MSQSVLLDISRDRLRSFEQAAALLRTRPPEEELAEDLEELVQACLDWPDVARRLWNQSVDRIAAGRIRDLQAAGVALRNLFEGTTRYLEDLRGWAEDLNRKGFAIGSVADLGRAVEELRELQAHAFAPWPWIDQATVAEAVAEYERGDALPLDEAFAAIAGVDKEAWLRRAAEHRRPGGDRVEGP